MNYFEILEVTLTLTSDGLSDYKKVLEVVFAFINLMVEQGPQNQNFEEVQKGNLLKW